MLKRISIFGRVDREDSLKILQNVINHLNELGIETLIEKSVSRALGLKEGIDLKDLSEGDILVTIGGDGTILRALLYVNLPVFPIKVGKLGFLTEVDAKEWKYGLDMVLEGKYYIEEFSRLLVEFNGEGYSLTNEVSIKGEKLDKLNSFEIYFSSGGMWSIQCDGIVISTPLGSTGYSLSLGGPVLHCKVKGFVLIPIAPFREVIRSIILPSEEELKIRVKNNGAYIIFDGQILKRLAPDDEIIVKEDRERKTKIIRIRKRGILDDILKRFTVEHTPRSP